MSHKLRLWKEYSSFEAAEAAWDKEAESAAAKYPIKGLKHLPTMVGITPDAAKGLKWKSLKWLIAKDHDWKIIKSIFKHPFIHAWRWLKSVLKAKPYIREGDFFFYGVESLPEFLDLLKDPEALFVLGFSYCHKPFECPSGRFSAECIHDPENPICRQCFIGKAVNALPEHNSFPLFIPTLHYVGRQIADLLHQHPGKRLLFVITACELTLEMFGDWGNMAGIKGVGVRLDGRICNTMEAFKKSEEGIKPGLTVVLPDTQRKILDILKEREIRVRGQRT